jgi:hypothetical protein
VVGSRTPIMTDEGNVTVLHGIAAMNPHLDILGRSG